ESMWIYVATEVERCAGSLRDVEFQVVLLDEATANPAVAVHHDSRNDLPPRSRRDPPGGVVCRRIRINVECSCSVLPSDRPPSLSRADVICVCPRRNVSKTPRIRRRRTECQASRRSKSAEQIKRDGRPRGASASVAKSRTHHIQAGRL